MGNLILLFPIHILKLYSLILKEPGKNQTLLKTHFIIFLLLHNFTTDDISNHVL